MKAFMVNTMMKKFTLKQLSQYLKTSIIILVMMLFIGQWGQAYFSSYPVMNIQKLMKNYISTDYYQKRWQDKPSKEKQKFYVDKNNPFKLQADDFHQYLIKKQWHLASKTDIGNLYCLNDNNRIILINHPEQSYYIVDFYYHHQHKECYAYFHGHERPVSWINIVSIIIILLLILFIPLAIMISFLEKYHRCKMKK